MMHSTTKDRETIMKNRYSVSTLVSVVLVLGWLAAVPASWATDNFTAVTATDKPAKKPKQAKAPKPPSDKGSAESKAERDKRLLRECRGRPNAGACEGYAS
jgi:cytochrome c-type biogenesis protein CcmH/NrfG